MTTTKEHREGLIIQLNRLNKELDLKWRVFNHKDCESFKELTEIEIFILTNSIELVKQALINNEIDF